MATKSHALVIYLTAIITLTIRSIQGRDRLPNLCPSLGGNGSPDFVKCPTKTCRQHRDCWVNYGPPESCVCDPFMCGLVCLPESAQCLSPRSKSSEMRVEFNGTRIGDLALYSCRPGLSLRGPRVRHCMASQQWSQSEPECVKQTDFCFAPPYQPNTYVVVGGRSRSTNHHKPVISWLDIGRRLDYRSGEMVELKCLPGYADLAREGSKSTAVCYGSEWRFESLDCQRISCGPLIQPIRGKVIYTSGNRQYGAEAITRCDLGYAPHCADSDAQVMQDGKGGCRHICQTDGSWSDRGATCRDITCPYNSTALTNGQSILRSAKVNGSIEFTCNHGYELIGQGHQICQPNGRWNGGGVPECRRRKCDPPPSIKQGRLVHGDTTFGSIAKIQCEKDTSLSSLVDHLRCDLDTDQSARWLPSPVPSCNRHCFLFLVDNGQVTLVGSRPNGLQVRIKINSDRVGRGNSGPDNLVNDGIILSQGRVRHASRLEIECNEGYELAGTGWNQSLSSISTTTCHDGVWTVRSRCRPASCKIRPRTAVGARVRFYSQSHNAKARYECYPGYRMKVIDPSSSSAESFHKDKMKTGISSDAVIRCRYGEWVGKRVYCEPTTCQIPVNKDPLIQLQLIVGKGKTRMIAPSSSSQMAHQVAIQDNRLRFSCRSARHQLVGGNRVVRCHNSQWLPTNQVPRCEPMTLTQLPRELIFRLPL